jgi:hypothetical protein
MELEGCATEESQARRNGPETGFAIHPPAAAGRTADDARKPQAAKGGMRMPKKKATKKKAMKKGKKKC